MRVLLLLLGLLALIASISSASLGFEETMVQLGGYRSGRPAMYSPQAGAPVNVMPRGPIAGMAVGPIGGIVDTR